MNGQQNNNNNYSAADILRYLNGSMDRKDIYALERAMLDDELLADSVEGYKMMRETLSDEAILAKALLISAPKKKDAEKAPVIPLSRFRWLGYAAAASLIIAAGWWINNISGPSNQLNDSNSDNTNQAFVNAGKPDSNTQQQKVTLSGDKDVADAEQPNKEIVTVGNKPREAKTPINDVANVPEKNVSPLPANTSTLPTESRLAERKLAGSPDAARKISSSQMTSEGPISRFTISDSSQAVPSNGWDAYQEYLSQNWTLASNHNPVLITIFLGSAGEITTVGVEGAASEKEKTTITETIKSGPGWKNKTGKPAKAIIKFQ